MTTSPRGTLRGSREVVHIAASCTRVAYGSRRKSMNAAQTLLVLKLLVHQVFLFFSTAHSHLSRVTPIPFLQQRATSESWIDFCPKRLYDTSVKTGEEGSLAGVGIRSRRNRATGIAAHPTVNSDAKDRGVDGPPSGTFHFGSRGNGSANSSGSSFRAGAVAPRDTGNPSLSGRGGGSRAVGIVNITPLGGELTAEIPTSISASPAPSPSHSRTSSCLPSPSAAATTTGFSTSACSSTAPKSTAGTSKEKPHRFNAVDYEASAILLECRSGALLPRQQ